MTVVAAQQYHQNVVHFLRKAFTYADDGTTLSIGWLPEGASVVGGGVVVQTAFSGGTAPVADLGWRNAADGTTADTDDFATDLALTTAGTIVADALATAGGYESGAEAVVVLASSASPTAGEGVAYVEYIVDNS